jgi:photosystem II stability/assembly factor-like uncharacterized protein
LESPLEEHLYDIQIMGNKGWSVGIKGNYCISNDGGATWAMSQDDIGSRSWLYCLSFVDKQNGFVCGGNGTIRYTRDGKSWKQPNDLVLK